MLAFIEKVTKKSSTGAEEGGYQVGLGGKRSLLSAGNLGEKVMKRETPNS